MSEIWKQVIDFEHNYEVSDMGRVRSLTYYGKPNVHEMKTYIGKKGV